MRNIQNLFSLVLLTMTAIVAVPILLSLNVSADDVVDNVSITVPFSCTMSGSGMNTHNAVIANGTYQANIGTTTINALCNDNAGFSIYAAGYTKEAIGRTKSNKLVGISTGNSTIIDTGTATSGDISNWAMKLDTDSGTTYPLTITTGYDAYHAVPNEYTKVATRTQSTDVGSGATGSTLTTTYAAYISNTQPADTYSGKVKYTLVHPNTAPTPPPVTSQEEMALPNSITVTSLPSDCKYDNEEEGLTNNSNIVVKAYTADGSLWEDDEYPGGIIPLEELYFSFPEEEFAHYGDGNVHAIRIVPDENKSISSYSWYSGTTVGYYLRTVDGYDYYLNPVEPVYLTKYGNIIYARTESRDDMFTTYTNTTEGSSSPGVWSSTYMEPLNHNSFSTGVTANSYGAYWDVLPISSVKPGTQELELLKTVHVTWNRIIDNKPLEVEFYVTYKE